MPFFSLVQEEPRTIYHFHYTAWPDHGVPQDPADVLAYLDDVNQQQKQLKELELSPGPVVVHCRCVCVCVCACVCSVYACLLLACIVRKLQCM